MPNTIKLLIPIVLGIAAAVVNFMVLSKSYEQVQFVATTGVIEKGDSFTGKIETKGVPSGLAGSLASVAIPAKSRGLLSGQTATRTLQPGDLILYRDTTINGSPPMDFRDDREVAKPVPLDGNRLGGASVGDHAWFTIPGFEKSESSSGRNTSYTGESQKIGPFRILAIGQQMDVSSDQKSGFISDEITIAYIPGVGTLPATVYQGKNEPKGYWNPQHANTLLKYLAARATSDGKLKMLDIEFKPAR